MKVGITRNMIVASDAGGTVSFKRGQTNPDGSPLDVSPTVFGRLQRAGAAISLEKVEEPDDRTIVANVAEAAVAAGPEDATEKEDPKDDDKPKGKRK